MVQTVRAHTVPHTRFQVRVPPRLMCTSMWIKKIGLLYWPSRGQQMSHQGWIWGINCMQVRKHASEGSTLALRPRADVTTAVSVVPQKILMSSNFFKQIVSSGIESNLKPPKVVHAIEIQLLPCITSDHHKPSTHPVSNWLHLLLTILYFLSVAWLETSLSNLYLLEFSYSLTERL